MVYLIKSIEDISVSNTNLLSAYLEIQENFKYQINYRPSESEIKSIYDIFLKIEIEEEND
jgi:hypothetical protein